MLVWVDIGSVSDATSIRTHSFVQMYVGKGSRMSLHPQQALLRLRDDNVVLQVVHISFGLRRNSHDW